MSTFLNVINLKTGEKLKNVFSADFAEYGEDYAVDDGTIVVVPAADTKDAKTGSDADTKDAKKAADAAADGKK
jgi:hypothetical protein